MVNSTIEYDDFRTRLLDMLSIELGNGITVHTREISGSGAHEIEACSLSIPGKNISPVFYPAYFFEKYRSGTSFAEIMENIKDSIRFAGEEAFDSRDISEYSIAKGHIIPKLINKENNADWLSQVATTSFLDVAVVFLYVIKSEGNDLVSFTISREQMEDWHITVDKLLYDAVHTAQRLFPLNIQSIEDVLGLSDDDYYQTFYVMSNNKRHYGAACMLYENAISDFAERIGQSLYIIPSSVHEVLLVPEGLRIPPDELREMLNDVNSSIVRDDEVLSEKVYYFDHATGSLSIE